jgi:hypothetical protein
MKQYETFELRFSGEVLPDAWAQIDLTATFSCAQESLTVKGFYDGESGGHGVYVVRFLPQYAGVYRYQVSGAVTAEGEIVCEAASSEAHGLVRAVGTHFAFADGTPYIPFGTTVYALISQDDALVEQTLQSLAAAPFNKLRLCVFPKDYDYNHNEPPLYAFARREDGSWDTSRPSVAFYQRLERILRRIAAMGIQLDLILFHPYDRWGFAAMPQADNFRYLDYLLRRLSAMPEIWWSLANEYDLFVPFGVAFQLPVVLYLTTRVGLTTPDMLRSKRKYVILAIFVLAAILTPPDVVSQVALGLPMCGLYEIGILVSRCTKARERA